MRSDGPQESAAATGAVRHFVGRGAFLRHWREALDAVAREGCRELVFCDRDYEDWPLGERDTIERLSQWAMSHRRLVLLAVHFDAVQRLHPRWVEWRRTWSHVVHCRAVDEGDIADIPSMVLAPGLLSLRVRGEADFRGRLSYDRADAVRDRDDIDAFLQRSHDAFPVTRLGL
jgi:hypothetical protein